MKPAEGTSSLKTLEIIFAAIFMVQAFLQVAGMVERVFQSSDTAWLIKTGLLLWQAGPSNLFAALHQGDTFSFTACGQPVLIYQWLFTLALAAATKVGALAGQNGAGVDIASTNLVAAGYLTYIATALLLLFLLPYMMLKRGVKPVYTFGLLTLINMPIWYWARPQLVSFFMLPMFILLLEDFRRNGYRKRLWLLPFLLIVWVNSHAFCFMGLALILAYLAPQVVSQKQVDFRYRRHLVGILATSCLAPLANPYGAELVRHTLSFVSEPDFGQISELQPTLLTNPLGHRGIWLYLVIAWSVLLARRAMIPLTGLFFCALSTFTGVVCYRFAAVAVLITWSYLSIALGRGQQGSAGSASGTKESASETDGSVIKAKENASELVSPVSTALALVAPIFATAVYFNYCQSQKQIWFTHNDSNQKVTAFLKQNSRLRSRLFCDAALGCSLILEDQTPVFIDTRFDLYGKTFCREYQDCLNGSVTDTFNWRSYLDNWQINTLAIKNSAPLTNELNHAARQGSCKKLYDDGIYSVWEIERGAKAGASQ
ncbi:MAG: hypothetical protein HY986_11640 [Candidatus Melainabacteria bacterium]|nr:hypothetical protein [Candidatus Melainabacteria bacterium]